MLVCPKCQFKNPSANKFCQQCGTSLTHKVCSECGAQVALSAQNCHNCGAAVGTVWLAIIWEESAGALAGPHGAGAALRGCPQALAASAPQEATLPKRADAAVSSDTPAENSATATAGYTTSAPTLIQSEPPAPSGGAGLEYLDAEQRYRLLEPLPPEEGANTAQTEVRVLDCKPFQLSPLAAFAEACAGQTQIQPSASAKGEAARPEVKASVKNIAEREIPVMAQAYLALQSQLYLNLPAIHDAWGHRGQSVVLLEERSDLPLLSERWDNDSVATVNLLHWLYEMASLWAALEPWSQRQSLLVESNLRVDENEILCLRRLYPEQSDAPIGLQDLGQLWQGLFERSGRTQLGSVTQLLRECCQGEIQTVDTLRSRLDEIAEELETSAPRVPVEIGEDDEDIPTIILPVQLLALDYAGRTDIGRQRDHNEDYFGIDTKMENLESPQIRTAHARCLFVLCDGMGGHASGEVASALAADTLRQYFQTHWLDQMPAESSIREAVLSANRAIYELNQKEKSTGQGRMGTTLVMALLQDTQVAIAHVGDSRLYRVSRQQGLQQLTADHEVGQREIKRGVAADIAYSRPDAYQLTQALGPRSEEFINPDVQFLELHEDTLLLLASDGLTDNNLLETHWETLLAPLLSPDASLERGVSQLIDLANQYNGHDNITALVVRVLVQPGRTA
ncbi:serine/threonine phosphatase [Kamptonema formosum]|uniref:serine/threonine phosphatase n=1 Tax=Kamptonema formosum TaxID=331992 RepID=UPI0003739B69|nr:serine/threonine phosphatase [Oscillatoria sp. PCC 10802]